MIPALEHLKPAGRWRFVVIKSRNRSNPHRPPAWCGFFPLVEKRRFRGLPIRHLHFLQHDYCFLRTPLIRRDDASEIVSLFFDWALQYSKVSLMDLSMQSGDGLYHSLLVNELYRRDIRSWMNGVYGRAVMRKEASDDAYLWRGFQAER